MVVNPALLSAAKNATNQLMDAVKGVRAVVVSTEDGFEVASCVQNTAQVSRLSAMASSLAALGALAGEESQLGICDSVVMEAAEGYLAIVQVRRSDVSLILSVVSGRDAIMGQVLYFSRRAALALQTV
jgi:uncharacterized protein